MAFGCAIIVIGYLLAASLFTTGTVSQRNTSALGAPYPANRLNSACDKPSIDGLQHWIPSEGTMVPTTETLIQDGSKWFTRVEFKGSEWHTFVVWLGNKYGGQADLTKSAGFTVTYSSTDDFYVQLRPFSHWSGGDKWLTTLPSTGGQLQTKTIKFDAASWTYLAELGKPDYTFASALTDASGLVFVGKTPNKLEFRALPIDGFTPPCNPWP
ncbi:hypothetical protein D5S17_03715 [Pseudonocardiaceae bacterium YIM PH 21723]|nr:hypothetical protein D5S17_03715 [Pseudonocardiaceae bacterium YIM PH 21723]